MLQEGYIIASIDNRGTGGKGRDFRVQTYPELGKLESQDHIAFAKYLGEMDFINPERIGIWGWSYGGYMSSLSLFIGEGAYRAAMAVAPVGSWRFYDTIYTERYLKLPQNNPGGYDNFSPLTHATKLEYPYLLVHGTGDDNVHVQNAYALQNKLIAANKQFDLMIYPDRAHSIYSNGARRHVYEKLHDWVLKNL
jgi:dipeptidyl-peptidase-4